MNDLKETGKKGLGCDCLKTNRGVILSRLELFDRGTAFLEKDAVTAVWTADVDIDLDLLFAPGALV